MKNEKERKYDYKKIDFLALLPCPMKAAFGHMANRVAHAYCDETGESVNFFPESSMNTEILQDLASIEDLEEFPDVMLLPYFGFPYSRSFRETFRNKGCFESIMEENNPLFQKYEFYDPKHYYDMVGISLNAFFADTTYYPELKIPGSWRELLSNPQYVRMVGMPGQELSGFQDFPVLAAYHLCGEIGVNALAKRARSCMLPAEMVRMAGSHRKIAPAIGILNYNMALAAGQKNRNTKFIWPEEGLFCEPITMLTKKTASEKARNFAKRLLGAETASAFRMGGFYSAADETSLGDGKLFWQGWEFLEKNDMPSLIKELCSTVSVQAELVESKDILKEEHA